MASIAAQLVADGLVAASSYALLTIAFALLYRVTGFFQFTFGSIYAAASYATVAAASTRLRLATGLLFAIAAAVTLALILHFTVYRRLLILRSPPLMPMLASIGAVAVIENLFALAFGPQIRVAPAVGSDVLQVGPVRMTELRTTQMIACALIAAAFVTWLNRSTIGSQLRAVASDVELAAIHGMRVGRITTGLTAAAAMLAAVPAFFAALDTGAVPQSGAVPLLMAITAMIVGGLQNAWGWVIGAVAVAFFRQSATLFLSAHWVDTAMFCVLCTALLARRRGIATALRARYAA